MLVLIDGHPQYQGVYGHPISDSYQTADGKPAGWWWLRSPGNYLYPGSAAGVDYDGSIYSDVVCHVDSTVVRPAFWLNLESDIF